MGLNVLRLSERVPPLRGGKEVHVAELTRAQVNAGHDVQILYRAGDSAQLAAPAIRVQLPPPLTHLGGLAGTALFSATAAAQARKLAKFDIVHAHGDIAEAWCMLRYARRAGAAAVLTVHAGLNPRYARLSRRAFGGVDAVIALGEGAGADSMRCGVPADRITVMSSGVNPELIAAAHRGARREPGLVVTVGSLEPMKNVATVIRAVLAAPDCVGLHLEVIGDGSQRSELESLAAGSPRVRFRGGLSRPDVYRRVAAADAFVIASRRLPGKGEGIPTALLEAMALGRLPLVSTDATPRPVVTDDRSYRTFRPDDVEHLTRLLVEAVTEQEPRTRIGERARLAVAHLGWPEQARRVEEVYARARVESRRRQ